MSFREPSLEEIRLNFPEYENVSFHRKGGFKAVYFGEKESTREAIKLVHIPNPQTDNAEEREDIVEENIKRVIRELGILRDCVSPFIVKLGSLHPIEKTIGGERFIAYSEEYLAGRDLHIIIREGIRPSEEELRKLIVCLVSAIKDLWINLRVVHRDIKPLNVIKIGNVGREFVLLDFGIAYAIRDTSLTINPVNIPGTLYYIAPEMLQANFRETLDYRSDLYTMGLTVYEYATGIQPFARREDAAGQTFTRILRERPKPLEELRSDLSAGFCEIINQLLKKKPALRPSNLDRLISSMEVPQ
jgi:serine/threonine protein kinase